MSQGSWSGRTTSWKNAMSPDWQLEIGPLNGLPIIPCPRCGDRVLELRSRKNDGQIFFKYSQNDQDVPPEYRKCGFYKLVNEYAGVVAGQGMDIGRYGSVEQRRKLNRGEVEVKQRRKTPNDAQKMDKLIKLNEWILITNVAVVVIVSLGLLVMLVK